MYKNCKRNEMIFYWDSNIGGENRLRISNPSGLSFWVFTLPKQKGPARAPRKGSCLSKSVLFFSR